MLEDVCCRKGLFESFGVVSLEVLLDKNVGVGQLVYQQGQLVWVQGQLEQLPGQLICQQGQLV